MDFLKTGIKTVLGSVEPGQQPTAAETVEKLVERVTHSTLLDDRRDACRALKALSRKYRVEVGAQGIQALVYVLENDGQDMEIVSYALDTLHNIMNNDYDDESSDSCVTSRVGVEFTEMFIKNTENVSHVMRYLEEYDFRVRRASVQLLTTLITNKTRDLQDIILVSPMGISKLMDLLTDRREVIRNDTLLLLFQLTKGNSNIQKIVAFENAFDRIFEIMRDEGYCNGGIVVEDCLILLLNLLKNNVSNQQFFKEGSFIQRLASMFEITQNPEETSWSPQKISNFYCMLQIVRALVTPSNQQHVITSCQKAMRQSRLLNELCNILMCGGVPADILTETINAVAEVVRGDADNQEDLSKVMAPSTPPRSAILVLLMSMINEKQILPLRCAVLYSFQSYLYRNENAQQSVVKTLLPSAPVDASALSTGQILCTGLFSSDPLANWLSAVALMHCIIENDAQKKELLRVLLAAPDGQKSITLLEQCTILLQQDTYNIQGKIGLLMLLCAWIANCSSAVKALLQTTGTMSYLTAQISCNEHDETEYLLQGLCAFLLGLCIQFNDDSRSSQKREDLCQLVEKRIGQEMFCKKLNEVSRQESYSRACKQPQIRVKFTSELLLDYEFCKIYKSYEVVISKMVTGLSSNAVALTELNLDSEASALVSQYKGIIREMDEQINTLKQTVQQLQEENISVKAKLDETQISNTQIADQNALLKAQLQALQNGHVFERSDDGAQSNDPIAVETNEQANTSEVLESLHRRLDVETQRADEAVEKFQKLQKDQENLMELLMHQENVISQYEQRLRAAGLPLEDRENSLE